MSEPTAWPSAAKCKHPRRFIECPDCAARWGLNDLDRLRAEVARLRKALRDYGSHHHSCRKNTYPLLAPKICDCGWTALLASTAPKTKDVG